MSNIDHIQIEKYLLSNKWYKTKEDLGIVSLWKTTYQDRDVVLIVPLNKEYVDYQDRIDDIIRILCVINDCSKEELVLDILLENNNAYRDLEIYYKDPYYVLSIESENIAIELYVNDLYNLMKECFKLYKELLK